MDESLTVSVLSSLRTTNHYPTYLVTSLSQGSLHSAITITVTIHSDAALVAGDVSVFEEQEGERVAQRILVWFLKQ